ncbi:ABC transporter permease (plasmid) [Fulvitalea axinellae]|uniref:ABC transporter permease n=1 Tax=Fulvitalea axinellae TaxID=1182444 RepID=A0AAU9DJY9_9BACT|nr:ABC transporter permease [Fulvitalea axinellae]
MLFYYLKISIRRLLRDKVYATVNILGLAVALTACLLLYTRIYRELATHLWHSRIKDVSQVLKYSDTPDGFQPSSGYMPTGLGPELKEKVPEVLDYVRIADLSTLEGEVTMIMHNGVKVPERRIIFSESSLFDVFGYRLLAGKADALDKKDRCAVISEDKAIQYFGKENAVGKQLEIYFSPEYSAKYTVVGVMEEMGNSSLQADLILNIESSLQYHDEMHRSPLWDRGIESTYLKMAPGHEDFDIHPATSEIFKRHKNEIILNPISDKAKFKLHDFAGSYLRGDHFGGDFRKVGSTRYLWLMVGLSAFLLVLSLLNFTISVLARSQKDRIADRTRRALGEKASQVFGFLFAESFTVVLASTLLALLVVPFVNNFIGDLLDSGKVPEILFPKYSLPLFLCLVVIFSGVTALFVALFRYRKAGFGVMVSQRTLLVFQLMLLCVVFTSSLLFFKQMRFVQEQPLGYDVSNTVSFPYDRATTRCESCDIVRKEVEASPLVEALTGGKRLPLKYERVKSEFDLNNGEKVSAVGLRGDASYIKVFRIKMLEGENLSSRKNKKEVLVNERFAKMSGFKNPVGETITSKGKKYTIVGVVKDFNVYTLYRSIPPCIIYNRPIHPEALGFRVRLAENNPDGGRKFLMETLQKHLPNFLNDKKEFVFKDSFADDYEKDIRFAKLVYILTGLSVFLVTLGLFGFTYFVTQARTKEIGIRKANGATTFEILTLFNNSILKQVLLAFVIAVPIAYLAMGRWLENFAYKTQMSWWIFAGAGLLAGLVALATVSWQSWRAASREPVEALRYE